MFNEQQDVYVDAAAYPDAGSYADALETAGADPFIAATIAAEAFKDELPDNVSETIPIDPPAREPSPIASEFAVGEPDYLRRHENRQYRAHWRPNKRLRLRRPVRRIRPRGVSVHRPGEPRGPPEPIRSIFGRRT